MKVQSLGQQDSLEKEMSTHSSILARKIPWTKEPGRLQSMWLQRIGQNGATKHTHSLVLQTISTKNACPLQKVKSLSRVRLLETPSTAAPHAPLSMGFSRQEYWSGLTCPPPGDLPDPGIRPAFFRCSALVDRFFTINATWETMYVFTHL